MTTGRLLTTQNIDFLVINTEINKRKFPRPTKKRYLELKLSEDFDTIVNEELTKMDMEFKVNENLVDNALIDEMPNESGTYDHIN